MKLLPILVFLLILISVASGLGYLAYEADAQTAQKREVTLSLQDTARVANDKAGEFEQKFARRDESELIAILQRTAATVGIADSTGKLLDVAQGLSIARGLYPKVIVDSVLLARFPQYFKYEIKRAETVYFAPIGFSIEQTPLKNGKIVCKHCAGYPHGWNAIFYPQSITIQQAEGAPANVRINNQILFAEY